jgi:ATPase subunit of ABC transporter with duplicated ATPase domains
MNRLKINVDFMDRWDTLSHGERKRIQLGIALWKNPPLLAVDEPTNHLDREARHLVSSNLEEYRGIGLLVSHDRTLLDHLCGNCLFLRNAAAVMRPGGITAGMVEEERELLTGRRLRQNLISERGRLAAEADSLRRLAESAKNRLSKKHVDPNDQDAKGKINLAKHTGKDASGTRLYKNMQNRVSRVDHALENVQVSGEQKKGVTLQGVKARMDTLWRSLPGTIKLGEDRLLRFPELVIIPESRIALTGLNGAGKSTLIGHILAGLPPQLNTLYVPQEISIEESTQLLQEVLEEMLSEVEAAFLLASHDELFLSNLTSREWGINEGGELGLK